MNVDYTKVYKFDEEFEMLQREDKYLYINYEDVNWFRTNDTGKAIIDKCDGQRTMEQVLTEIAAEKGFGVEALKTIFENYIDSMIQSCIVYDVNDEDAIPIKPEDRQHMISDQIGDLWIHVSGKCNLKCPFCYSLSGENNKNVLDCDKLIHFLSDIEEEKGNSIIISGGEPFLYDDLEKLVKKLKEMKFRSILIITNGTAGEEKYEKVIPYVDGIQVSVDGTTADIHDISRGEGSYDKMVKNLALLKKLNVPKLIISFTPTSKNIDDLPNIPKFVYDHNIDAIHVTRLMPVGRGKNMNDELTVDSKRYTDNFKEFVDNFNKIENIISIDRELYNNDRSLISLTFAGDQTYKVAYRQRKITCGAGLGSMSIYFNGKIYPCASLQNTAYEFGTIDDPIEKVIEKAREFMLDVSVERLPKCKECKFKYMCGGGCRACAYACSENKDIYAEDPMCERYQREMLELLWRLERKETGVKDWKENPLSK